MPDTLPEGFVLEQQPQASTAEEGLPEGFVLEDQGKDLSNVSDLDKFMVGLEHLPAAAWEGIKHLISAPRDAYTGERPVFDPETRHVSDDAIGTGFGMATVAVPASPGGGVARLGRAAAEAAPTVDFRVSPTVQSVDRLSATGEPVRMPQGVASDRPMTQAIYQRGAQVPGASGVISKSVDNFVSDVGGKANELALKAAGRTAEEGLPTAEATGAGIRTKLQGLVSDNDTAAQQAISAAETNARSQIGTAEQAAQTARQEFDNLAPQAPAGTKATVGDELTTALEERTKFHRAEQEKPYTALRQIIDAEAPVPLPRSVQETLQSIGEARIGAGFEAWPKGTEAVARIVSRGDASFNNLQRLRKHIGGMIDDWKPGSGFDEGDLKQLYGSLTTAMENAVSTTAKGGAGQAAVGAFKRAETNFGSRADVIRELNGALRNGPESLVDRMVGYASERGGANFKKLQELQRELPGPAQDKASRLAFQRLSRGTDGQFSEAALVKNWANLSPEGKQALFRGNAPKIEAAIRKLQDANATAKATRDLADATVSAETKAAQARSKEASREYVRMLAQSDEQLARTLLKTATDGATANASKLARMVHTLGPDHVKNLAGLQIQEMGLGRTGEFSPGTFRSAWNNLSDSGKAMLFPDLALRRALEDLHVVTERMVQVREKFSNKSGTAGAVGLGAVGAGLMANPVTTIATVAGANFVARVLSKPATVKAAADLARAQEAYLRAPTQAALARVKMAHDRLVKASARAAGLPANDNNDLPSAATL